MKKTIKHNLKKVLPIGVEDRLNEVNHKLDQLDTKIDAFKQEFSSHDFRIDELKEKIKHVEPYQPIYGISGIVDHPVRECINRAEVVYKELENNVKGTKMLDIGSSLGYIPFYFSDRGAHADGWDLSPGNIEVSNLSKQINGSNANFYNKELDNKTISIISNSAYDVITVFNVFHHIVAYKGLPYAQSLVRDLTNCTPIMFIELAQKGEDKSLFWDKHIPKNDLVLLKLCKDVDIVKVGEFQTHLSKKKRPMYKVTRKNIKVNNRNYLYKNMARQAYKNSNVGLQRTYFKTLDNKYFIKKYNFNKWDEENQKQIINEINFLLQSRQIKNIPSLIDFEIKAESATLVLNNIKGELIFECKDVNPEKVAKILIDTFYSMEKNGFYHNDIRSWNVLYDNVSTKTTLIDFGMVYPTQNENNMIAFLWAIWGMINNHKESFETSKTQLPNKNEGFSQNSYLLKIYEEIEKNLNLRFEDLINIAGGE